MKMFSMHKQSNDVVVLFENLDFLSQNTNRVYFKYDRALLNGVFFLQAGLVIRKL